MDSSVLAKRKRLVLVISLLPVLGALVSPFYALGEYAWWLKSLVGLLFGASLSLILVRSLFVPPYATVISAFASLLLFSSMAVLAFSAPAGSVGTVIVGAVIAGIMFWALTR